MIIQLFISFLLSLLLVKFFGVQKNVLACGLAGFSGEKLNPYKFKLLLLANQSRGTHSTGLFVDLPDTEGSTARTFKKACSATEMFNDFPDLHKILNTKGINTVIGHTRHATIGAKTEKNAHPFTFYNSDDPSFRVTGTHNGWLTDSLHEIKKKYCNDSNIIDVDSQAIFYYIAGQKDVTAFQHIKGAMALAFTMEDGKDLYIYRRSSKPLFIGRDSDGLYYSSLEKPLYWAGLSDVKEIETDKLYHYKLGELVEVIDVPDPHKKDQTVITLDEGPAAYRNRMSPSTSYYGQNRYSGYAAGGRRVNHQESFGQRQSSTTERRTPIQKALNSVVGTPSLNSVFDACGNFLATIDMIEMKNYNVSEIENLEESIFRSTNKIPKESGTIIINLTDYDKGKAVHFPLGNFRVMVNNKPYTINTTNEKGQTVINFDSSMFSADGLLDLIILPPSNFNKKGKKLVKGEQVDVYKIPKLAFTKSLELKTGGVSEVTLRIPFHQQAEKAEEEGKVIILRDVFTLPTDQQEESSETKDNVESKSKGDKKKDKSSERTKSDPDLNDNDSIWKDMGIEYPPNPNGEMYEKLTPSEFEADVDTKHYIKEIKGWLEEFRNWDVHDEDEDMIDHVSRSMADSWAHDDEYRDAYIEALCTKYQKAMINIISAAKGSEDLAVARSTVRSHYRAKIIKRLEEKAKQADKMLIER